ncbi:MAG TPA: ATP phosphoribosyltransferase regulatory subunit [Dehalococcoidia bacterium]
MPEAPATQRSKGMRDLLPDEMERLRAVESAFAAACRAWGYREIRTPVIEPLHLFTTAGTLSPQTLDRVYSFLDWDGWSGERVVLRPDSTIPAARLYAERLNSGRIAKLFYSQNVFRFTDDDSPREEWQFGVELIGDTGVAGDVELVLLALEALRPLGLPPVSVRLSHAGIVRGVLAAAGLSTEEQSSAYDRLLDGDVSAVDDVEARMPQLNATLRLLFEVDGAGSGYIANLRGPLVDAIPALSPAFDQLAFVVAALEAQGVAPVIQTVLARSFEYYSGLVMKLDSGGRRIAVGGRYDELIGLVGGKAVPASGFGLYVSPLVELSHMRAAATNGRRVIVDARDLDPAVIAETYVVAASLRAAGIGAETTQGMDSSPTHWLVCSSDTPRFRLFADGVDRQFASLEDVMAALELAG